MPCTAFPSKRVMRAYRHWRGWPDPPRVVHVNELQAWIDRQKVLTGRERHGTIETNNPVGPGRGNAVDKLAF